MENGQPQRFAVGHSFAPTQPQQRCADALDGQRDSQEVERQSEDIAHLFCGQTLLHHETGLQGDTAADQTQEQHAERNKPNAPDLY